MANIIIAQPHGFCFGVNRAVDLAQKTAQRYSQPIYFLGEIVHNQHVIDWLKLDLKIKTVKKIEDIPPQSVVIIQAHGVAPQIYQQAKDRQLTIVDATCPLVLKSHQTVKNLAKEDKKIIFICNKIYHDETIGVLGEAPQSITPVTLKDISNFKIKNPDNTVVITQTTLSTLETQSALDHLKEKYPQITIHPHICQATTERQSAIINLVKKYKFVIIVGSPTSANSNSLRQVAEDSGATAYIIDNASQLKKEWLKDQDNIVVSSGASTPESVLDQVINKIKNYE